MELFSCPKKKLKNNDRKRADNNDTYILFKIFKLDKKVFNTIFIYTVYIFIIKIKMYIILKLNNKKFSKLKNKILLKSQYFFV